MKMKKILLTFCALTLAATTAFAYDCCNPEPKEGTPVVKATSERGTFPGDPGPLVLTAEEEEAWKKEPAYSRTILVGYNGGLCLGSFGIGQVKGFYADEGLKTEIKKFSGAQLDAVCTGKVDITGDHIASLVVPAINGVRLVFTTGIHTGCKSIYAWAEGDVKSTADLKGKAISISDGLGASDHNITLRLLAADGIDPVNDVSYKVVDYGAAIQALEKGELAGAMLSDQFATGFGDKLRRIRSITDDSDFEREICCIHAVNLDFYNQNPITVKKLTNAHERAKAYMHAFPDESCDILQANNWASGDPAVVKAFFKTLHYDVGDFETTDTLKKVIADYLKFGILTNKEDPQTLLDRVWKPQGLSLTDKGK